MTFPFAALTIGLIFIYTAFKDATVGEILRGEENDGAENTSFLGGDTSSRLASFVSGGIGPNTVTSGKSGNVSSSKVRKAKGTKVWKNGNVTVAAWIYYELKRIGFTGTLTSGFRTPAYSESLCIDMCGQPTCAGKCGGKSSNHSGKVFPKGAFDVAEKDRAELLAKIKKHNSPLKNDLPADRIHFSISGH